MIILFISNYSAYSKESFGGAEVSMRLLAEHQACKGHAVFYVSKDREGGVIPRLIKKNINGVKLNLFRVFRGEKLFQASKRVNDFLFERHVQELIRKNGVQIAYCTYDLDTPSLLLKLRDAQGQFKIVLRMAGMYWAEACVKNSSIRGAYEKIFNRIDAVNYVAPGLENLVHEKIGELAMDVDFSYSFTADIGTGLIPGRPRPYARLNNERFTMVMAGRFSRYQKRQDLLVRAVSLIEPGIPVCLKLVGDGKRRNDIQLLIDRLNLGDRVKIVPFMKQSDLWQMLLQADLLCHACDYEGTSKIILESMALGLPVLVSDVAPVNSYVTDGENGFLVDNDPALWAAKIKWLMGNKRARIRVSLNAMRHVALHYNPEVNTATYERHFEQILRNP